MSNQTKKDSKTKKVWSKPEIILISKANEINGGAQPGAHEANFTPNHTHYNINGDPGNVAVASESLFLKYIS